jgi:hypothetical protein
MSSFAASVSIRIPGLEPVGQIADMSWKTVRLELARSAGYPNGSATRAYLLHLPLEESGLVNEDAFQRSPALATVRRHWPNERDRAGYVIRKPKGWAFSYAPGDADDEDLFHLEAHPLRPGEYVTIIEPDGDRLPYRVVAAEAQLAA